MNDNLPLGADKDPRAPYNEELNIDRDFYVSFIISGPVRKNIPPDVDIEFIKNEIIEDIKTKLDKLIGNEYIIDNIIINEE